MPIDDTDRKIIAVLDRDASLTNKEIAKRLGMNESTVNKRITILKEKKVITYYVQIDTFQIGLKTEASLGVDVEASHILDAAKRLVEIPGVRMVFHCSGEHDYWVVIWTTDREALSRIVDQVSAVEGVTNVVPSVLLERIWRKPDLKKGTDDPYFFSHKR